MSFTKVTYDAYGGQTHYHRTFPDKGDGVTGASGPNPPDNSIKGALNHAADGEAMVKFLRENYLTPVMVVRAYNACGDDGVKTVLTAVENIPEIKAWYETFPPLIVSPFPTITPAVPDSPEALVIEGNNLIAQLRDHLAKLQALIK